MRLRKSTRNWIGVFAASVIEALLAGHAAEGPAALRDALLSAVRAHSGGRAADDDRTLLILTLE